MIADPAFWYIMGWISAVAFIAIGEWVIALKQEGADPMSEIQCDPCPWPVDAKFPHRLQGVPEIITAAPSQRDRGDILGTGTKHLKTSSPFFSAGSEGSR